MEDFKHPARKIGIIRGTSQYDKKQKRHLSVPLLQSQKKHSRKSPQSGEISRSALRL